MAAVKRTLERFGTYQCRSPLDCEICVARIPEEVFYRLPPGYIIRDKVRQPHWGEDYNPDYTSCKTYATADGLSGYRQDLTLTDHYPAIYKKFEYGLLPRSLQAEISDPCISGRPRGTLPDTDIFSFHDEGRLPRQGSAPDIRESTKRAMDDFWPVHGTTTYTSSHGDTAAEVRRLSALARERALDTLRRQSDKRREYIKSMFPHLSGLESKTISNEYSLRPPRMNMGKKDIERMLLVDDETKKVETEEEIFDLDKVSCDERQRQLYLHSVCQQSIHPEPFDPVYLYNHKLGKTPWMVDDETTRMLESDINQRWSTINPLRKPPGGHLFQSCYTNLADREHRDIPYIWNRRLRFKYDKPNPTIYHSLEYPPTDYPAVLQSLYKRPLEQCPGRTEMWSRLHEENPEPIPDLRDNERSPKRQYESGWHMTEFDYPGSGFTDPNTCTFHN